MQFSFLILLTNISFDYVSFFLENIDTSKSFIQSSTFLTLHITYLAQGPISSLVPVQSVLLDETKNIRSNNSQSSSSSDLHAVKKVSDHLQERTEDNADCTGHDEGDDSLVGIVLLRSCSDGLHQKLMSVNDVDTWVC